MTPTYLSLTFQMGDHDHEIWQALLGEWPFESFHDEEDHIIGYIQDHDITESLMQFISSKKGTFFLDYELAQVADKNWNEVWESSFNPVAIGDEWYIRAEFHKPVEKKYRHIITISPKMAFGTGHHATTFMMLQAMSHIDFSNTDVFDFGCGTGILSVAAAKLGAKRVFGVDIQPEAIENSIEHAQMNDVSTVCEFKLGGLEKVDEVNYDVILANINRNVILDHLPSLMKCLHPNGFALFSGIMFDDVSVIKEALDREHMKIISKKEKDQWVQLTTTKV